MLSEFEARHVRWFRREFGIVVLADWGSTWGWRRRARVWIAEAPDLAERFRLAFPWEAATL